MSTTTGIDAAIRRLRDWGIDARQAPARFATDGAEMIEIVYVRRTKPSTDGKILILDTDAIAHDEAHLAAAVRAAGGKGVVLATNYGTPTNIIHHYRADSFGEPLEAPAPEGHALGHAPDPECDTCGSLPGDHDGNVACPECGDNRAAETERLKDAYHEQLNERERRRTDNERLDAAWANTIQRVAQDEAPEPVTAGQIMTAASLLFGDETAWRLVAGDNGGEVAVPSATVLQMAGDDLAFTETINDLIGAANEACRFLAEIAHPDANPGDTRLLTKDERVEAAGFCDALQTALEAALPEDNRHETIRPPAID